MEHVPYDFHRICGLVEGSRNSGLRRYLDVFR